MDLVPSDASPDDLVVTVDSFLVDVNNELQRHTNTPKIANLEIAYIRLLKIVDKLWDEVCQHPSARFNENTRALLLQLVVTTCRIVRDLDLESPVKLS